MLQGSGRTGVAAHVQMRACLGGPVKARAKLLPMPTVLRLGPWRFFFYSAEHNEPSHIHVERESFTAKFWLDPVRLEYSRGFPRPELRRLEAIIEENRVLLARSWYEYFGS